MNLRCNQCYMKKASYFIGENQFCAGCLTKNDVDSEWILQVPEEDPNEITQPITGNRSIPLDPGPGAIVLPPTTTKPNPGDAIVWPDPGGITVGGTLPDFSPKCECGADKCGLGYHSTWCPKGKNNE